MCHKYTKCLNEVFRVKIGAILETLRPVENIIIHQLLKQEATKGWALITFFFNVSLIWEIDNFFKIIFTCDIVF